MTHCLQSSLRQRYAWKQKNSFTKKKAQDRVLFSEQIRNVDYKTYPDEQRDRLGKHKAMHRASRKLDATLWVTEFQAYLYQQFNSRMHKNNLQLPSWSKSSNHTSTKNNFSKIWVRRRRSTGFVKHRKNCCKIWTRHRPLNFARTLRNVNAPIAIPSRKSVLFIAVAGEIWSTSGVLQRFKKDNYDFNSIPGYIIKKNFSRGPKHGQSDRHIMFFQAKDMLR